METLLGKIIELGKMLKKFEETDKILNERIDKIEDNLNMLVESLRENNGGRGYDFGFNLKNTLDYFSRTGKKSNYQF